MASENKATSDSPTRAPGFFGGAWSDQGRDVDAEVAEVERLVNAGGGEAHRGGAALPRWAKTRWARGPVREVG